MNHENGGMTPIQNGMNNMGQNNGTQEYSQEGSTNQ